jgi:hypothetical protein
MGDERCLGLFKCNGNVLARENDQDQKLWTFQSFHTPSCVGIFM